MKTLEFSITWDRLNYGEFPTEEVKEADSNMSISFEKISNFQRKVTFKTLIENHESELEVAYTIGTFVHSIVRRKQAVL
ncbi:MAG: hypothetical protein EBR30_03710 [Cytophagia bacterium]|nr:hypothetical protein [Cytophagia bacterium]NBW34119.1 hypothetical protein [Cytophagia bacterium]